MYSNGLKMTNLHFEQNITFLIMQFAVKLFVCTFFILYQIKPPNHTGNITKKV